MEKKKILVIDDDTALLSMLDSLLTKRGFEVLTLNKPAKAQQSIMAWKPDLMICDMMMPDIDGIQVMLQVTQAKKLGRIHDNMKIVAMSGGGEKVSAAMYLKIARPAGANNVIFKPFGMDEIVDTINDTLSGIEHEMI